MFSLLFRKHSSRALPTKRTSAGSTVILVLHPGVVRICGSLPYAGGGRLLLGCGPVITNAPVGPEVAEKSVTPSTVSAFSASMAIHNTTIIDFFI
jgi:hypothetical protein